MQKKTKNKSANPEKSAYKFVVFTAPKGTPGQKFTYYSFPAEEAKGMGAVLGGLYQRICQKKLNMNFFYAMLKLNDGSDTVLRTVKGNRYMEQNSHVAATVRLVVYDKKNQRHKYLPNREELGKSHQYIIGSMQQRLLNGDHKGRFSTGIFYNTETDKEICRVRG